MDPVKEWMKQANYDFETAEAMYKGRPYMHAVLMIHLSLEKTLKGRYQQVLNRIPPKTHNLI